eukprot:739736-Pyramimonas_sp.AAC.1
MDMNRKVRRRTSVWPSVCLPASHCLSHTVWVTGSLGHSVTRHSVTQSLSHSVTRSLGHAVTQSLSQSVTQSLSHAVTQSLGHSVTQSISHTVFRSLSRSVTYTQGHVLGQRKSPHTRSQVKSGDHP